MQDFLEDLMERLRFPAQARTTLRAAAAAVEPASCRRELDSALDVLFTIRDRAQIDALLGRLTRLARRAGIHPYTLHLLFYMMASRRLLADYRAAGIPEDIFWNSVADLSYKLRECHDVWGVWGTFVAGWFVGFYQLKRFGLGRLQFEIDAFDGPDYTRGGHTVRRGDRVYQVHIPSAGPLTRESRMDSYRRAYAFFRPGREDRPLVLVCSSWLLFPDNALFFPPHSRILDFMGDFDLIGRTPTAAFEDAWRVFGKDCRLPPDRLPQDTSLQRAFAGWLKAGRPTGYGTGILLFDGAAIL